MSDDSPDMRYILQSRRAPAAVTDCSAGLRAGAGAAPGCTVPEHTRPLCRGAAGISPVLLQDGAAPRPRPHPCPRPLQSHCPGCPKGPMLGPRRRSSQCSCGCRAGRSRRGGHGAGQGTVGMWGVSPGEGGRRDGPALPTLRRGKAPLSPAQPRSAQPRLCFNI